MSITHSCLNLTDSIRVMQGSFEHFPRNLKPSDQSLTQNEIGSLDFHTKQDHISLRRFHFTLLLLPIDGIT